MSDATLPSDRPADTPANNSAGSHAGSQAGRLGADVIVLGGGLIGASTALALGRIGLQVHLVDRQPLQPTTLPDFDGRATAVALASKLLFQAIGVWDRLASEAGPINEIRVSDGPSMRHLHFDHRQLGKEPLGWMVENRHLRGGLLEALARCESVRVHAPAQMAHLERGPGKVRLTLSDGQTLHAPLILGCDGRQSALRAHADLRRLRWSYPQTAIVATIEHDLPHGGVAHERFLAAGPFAILPLTGNRASLVWTAPKQQAPALLQLGDRAFAAEVVRRVGDFLGEVRVLPQRWSYPLGLHITERFVDRRMALVGDAAHGIHPIAGQGFNLGLRDVAAITEILAQSLRLGLDPGAADRLARYDRARRADVMTLAAATDGLNWLFSNDIPPVRLARDIGLAAVNRMGPLKGFFMDRARGTLGARPALLQGRLPG